MGEDVGKDGQQRRETSPVKTRKNGVTPRDNSKTPQAHHQDICTKRGVCGRKLCKTGYYSTTILPTTVCTKGNGGHVKYADAMH